MKPVLKQHRLSPPGHPGARTLNPTATLPRQQESTPEAEEYCHGPTPTPSEPGRLRLALVGNPNVGKSVLFNRITGAYVTVSNYPGTSVALSRGSGTLAGREVEVVDTPGTYSLVPSTEEERVAQSHILDGAADVLIQVVDAKNLPRGLPLTLQLLDCRRPQILVLNMMDELESLGVSVEIETLRERLGIPVVPMVALRGEGMDLLAEAVGEALRASPPPPPAYPNGVGASVEHIRGRLSGAYGVDAAALATLALQGDTGAIARIREKEEDGGTTALEAAADRRAGLGGPAIYRVAFERQTVARGLLEDVLWATETPKEQFGERLGRLLARPATGIPILLLVLYLGLYQFVGVFGAGTLVDVIEGPLFEGRINPLLEGLFAGIPWDSLRSLFVGEYGMLTLGVRYAVAIILPVVGTFFLFFSVMEDSGYFPRLALLLDRAFKRIGLSGRAVIPMVLGFACGTMATMVTRTLETKRERVLATLLLALAIPCSAQLGVILAILSSQPLALGIWAISLLGIFAFVGWLSALLLPGEAAYFHMELPPMRLPRPGNVFVKTYSRMQWYFMEVLPLFLLASVILWAMDLTGLIAVVVKILTPVVGVLGLPAETATIFLLGFFRRDYGAAGLFDLNQTGALDVVQLTVAAVTLTLFVPCVAQFLMMVKERGWRTAMGMFLIVTPVAFTVGFLLNLGLRAFGW